MTVTHDLPSLWNADIKGSKFITNAKMVTKVDPEMMDFVGADNSLDSTRFSSMCLLLLFAIGELSMSS